MGEKLQKKQMMSKRKWNQASLIMAAYLFIEEANQEQIANSQASSSVDYC